MPSRGLRCVAAFLFIVHSGLVLLLWLAGVAMVQRLPSSLSPAVGVMAMVLALMLARERSLRLLRRIRFLLLAVLVLFAWFTPGEVLLMDFPRLSPTREGLRLALDHAARLLTVVAALAVLLQFLPVPRLVGGLYALCRPFGVIGLSAERLAVRLLLVLRHVETSDRAALRHWRHWLSEEPAESGNETLHLERERFGRLDVVLIVSMLGILMLWMAG